MFCSTIIPTVNRPTLSRAVNSVLNQRFTDDDVEVIVVNDSGQPLPEMDWQKSDRVQVINTNRRERSVARNTGAAVAKGRYLHFLDDDDYILPDAFESFWELAGTSRAAWLYGAYKLVDNTGKPFKEIYPDESGNTYIYSIASDWIPLQSSLIESEAFFAVGGFASLHSLLGGYEDIDLYRQITRYYSVAGTADLVACVRKGEEG
ncbi:MAG: glycosyltransferase family 2 protein, partial [Anaerolineae bacterium]